MSPAKTEAKQGKFVEFISPAKVYFRENTNSICPTPKFTLVIIQIKVKSLSSFLHLVQLKLNLSEVNTFNIRLQPDPEVRGVCEVNLFAFMLAYTSFFSP